MRVAESTVKILANIPLPDEVASVYRQAAVIDIGSCTTRIGFAGDDKPRIDEPTCVIKGEGANISASNNNNNYNNNNNIDNREKESPLCLGKAFDNRATNEISRVIEGGEVDWEAMEQLLQHLDDLLQLGNKEMYTPLLLTEKLLVPRGQRLRLAELLVEKHGVSALHFAPSPVLSLYAAGICTGVSVEMGHDASHVVPIFQGCPLFHAVHAINYAGDYFTRYMMSTGPELPAVVHPKHRLDVWQHLKEKYCEACPSHMAFCAARGIEMNVGDDNYNNNNNNNNNNSYSNDSMNSISVNNTTANYNNNNNNSSNSWSRMQSVQHQLPDGTIINMDSNRFVPAEMLLDPSLVPSEVFNNDQWNIENVEQLRTTAKPQGLHQLIINSINKCDLDLSPTFYDSIHFSGGCSLIRGIPERIGSEIHRLTDHQPRIIARTERRNAAFVGGSILASLPTFQDFWVTKADYEEFGPSAVLRRCF